MSKILSKIVRLVFFCLLLTYSLDGFSQISPGDLCNAHASLDGMSNCTSCHKFGEKIANDKCLACHKEIGTRIAKNKGYHSSSEVVQKNCISCHSDHHGRTFKIIRFDKDKFDHNQTGFKLEGVHAKKECANCHKTAFITDPDPAIKKKSITYLGLTNECYGCHEDPHKKTLTNNCSKCHTNEAFKPASKFDHAKAKFPLKGKHSSVECIKCHKINVVEGKNFQQFSGLQFTSCVNCHNDVHKNQFGPNCVQCHSEESFKTIKGIGKFDHSKTGYPLTGLHQAVGCKLCHKVSLTTPMPHSNCTDCHKDYHKGEFSGSGKVTDCIKCHSVDGFKSSSYSIEQHSLSGFKLEGAHLATPCFQCHKKEKDWKFRGIGKKCIDCHKNIHLNLMESKYLPDYNCEGCHNVNTWSDIKFDHNRTTFRLEGKHTDQSCRQCHFKPGVDGSSSIQNFASLKTSGCTECHSDIHHNQFAVDYKNDCAKCHGFSNWKPEKFDHNNSRFKLDGSHIKVLCIKCHKTITEGETSYSNYKLKDIKCAACHSR